VQFEAPGQAHVRRRLCGLDVLVAGLHNGHLRGGIAGLTQSSSAPSECRPTTRTHRCTVRNVPDELGHGGRGGAEEAEGCVPAPESHQGECTDSWRWTVFGTGTPGKTRWVTKQASGKSLLASCQLLVESLPPGRFARVLQWELRGSMPGSHSCSPPKQLLLSGERDGATRWSGLLPFWALLARPHRSSLSGVLSAYGVEEVFPRWEGRSSSLCVKLCGCAAVSPLWTQLAGRSSSSIIAERKLQHADIRHHVHHKHMERLHQCSIAPAARIAGRVGGVVCSTPCCATRARDTTQTSWCAASPSSRIFCHGINTMRAQQHADTGVPLLFWAQISRRTERTAIFNPGKTGPGLGGEPLFVGQAIGFDEAPMFACHAAAECSTRP
jgi:hypothetical protein